MKMPLELMTFDYAGDLGQARALDVEVAQERVDEILRNLPDEMITLKAWESGAGVFPLF